MLSLTIKISLNGYFREKVNKVVALEKNPVPKCGRETTRKFENLPSTGHSQLMSYDVKIFKHKKDMDICLLELREDVIETGRMNNVMLRSICLPKDEPVPGSSCFTSGINRDSKVVDAVPLNLFTNTYCDSHSVYDHFGTTLNQNQLCAGIPSKTDFIAPFSGKYEEDFGGPLICLDKTNQQPIFTGIASSNSLSTKSGQPGMVQFKPFNVYRYWQYRVANCNFDLMVSVK